jgi:hypothetical protein
MKLLGCVVIGLLAQGADVSTMTKMNVRLMGPGIRAGSNAALPKLIYRAGSKYARMEDAPEARQRIEKITIIAEPDAYSVDLMGRTGTHVIDQGGPDDMHLPMVLPFDPNHKLGILDRMEFGAELDFFTNAGATKSAGPIINAKPTDKYSLNMAGSHAELITRNASDVPVFVSWTSKDGTYKYEYSVYQEIPFDAKLFSRPAGIKFREIPPATPDELK